MQLNLIKLDRDFNSANVITNPRPVDEKSNKFNDDGIFSETTFGRMSTSTVEYACKCGALEGKFFDGIVCQICDSKAKLRSSSFDRKGWVYFHELQIINPIFFEFFAKIIGKTQFQKILDFNIKTDIDGNIIHEDNKDFSNIGIFTFMENWETILNFYTDKKIKKDPNIIDLYNLIIKHKDYIFTKAFPIFTASLRPAVLTAKHISFSEVNTSYNFMIAEANALGELDDVTYEEQNINNILNRIQKHANEIYEFVLTLIGGKGKYLRTSIFGTRLNFSARCVITPNPASTPINEVALPYLTFMEIYKFDILNIHSTIKKCSLMQSYNEWSKAQSVFSELFYNIIEEILSKAKSQFNINGVPVFINRNPSLHLGSILRMVVSEVKRDITDLTMSLSNCILSPLSADFDGDVLNIIRIPDMRFYNSFEIFDPRMIVVSRDAPELNSSMELTKDHVLGMTLLTEE